MRTNVMSKIKGAAKLLCYTLSIVVLLWIGKSTVDVWTGDIGQGNFWLLLANKTETDSVVTACVKSQGDRYYTVTVEDVKGNQWSYFDDEFKPVGTVLRVTWEGNKIVDAK